MTEHTEHTVYFPATVVRVIDDWRVVINRGKYHGIKMSQRFFVYCVDPKPITDPETGEQLGLLEVIRGIGIATHVQNKLTTVSSTRKKIPSIPLLGNSGETLPFDHPRIGDKAKPI